jgi:outer membrane protein assembly factor BamB
MRFLRSFVFSGFVKTALFAALSASILAPAHATAQAAEPGASSAASQFDWSNWKGPEQNRISREVGLVAEFDFDGKNLLWKNEKLATISTPIVMNGKLYTLCRSEPGTHREGEKVVCADAATGEVLWENIFNVYLSDVPDTRVAWSNVAGDPETGNIYAHGVCNYFQCIDGQTGKTLWSRSLSEEFGALSTYGGRTNTPVVFEDLVIISAVCINWGDVAPRTPPGTPPPALESLKPEHRYLAFDGVTGGKTDMARPAHRFIAMNKRTGEVLWFNGTEIGPKDTTYSTPTIGVINGQAVMVFGSGDGNVYAMQPRTGKILWKYALSRKGLNVSPIIVDGKVYDSQSEENIDNGSGAVVCLDGTKTGNITKTGEIWRVKEIMPGRSSPIFLDGRIYTMDDAGAFFVLDAATGKVIQRTKMAGAIVMGSPLYADGKFYACTRSAWHVFEPNEKGVKLLNRLRMPTPEEEVFGSPIVSAGRIYLPTTNAMYCIGEKGVAPKATQMPPQPKESSASEDNRPAHVQVVPAELLVKPGDKQQYTVRIYNSRGQLLKEKAAAEFAVTGPGAIDKNGLFVADAKAAHKAATIAATVDGLTGYARVRIVPPLPWKFDFADGEIPITWVAARYRHQIREVDGEKLMVKITTIPLGTRSQSWMGHTEFHDYTIQADIKGAITNDKMPDIGVIAQRYTLDLMGKSQQLQIRSWTAQLEHRFAKTIPFPWQADKWYTIKFRAATDGGKAVLKGKVWPKGTPEPKEWTIEDVDEVPNLVGSPGLFGNASDAEIFIDNITVTPNS